jgi:malate dehydrogenase (oxaloacetate-decarboxylating)(NADP+)
LQLSIGKPEKKRDLFIGCSKLMRERNYFAAMMVNEGEADGLVTGYEVTHQLLSLCCNL